MTKQFYFLIFAALLASGSGSVFGMQAEEEIVAMEAKAAEERTEELQDILATIEARQVSTAGPDIESFLDKFFFALELRRPFAEQTYEMIPEILSAIVRAECYGVLSFLLRRTSLNIYFSKMQNVYDPLVERIRGGDESIQTKEAVEILFGQQWPIVKQKIRRAANHPSENRAMREHIRLLDQARS